MYLIKNKSGQYSPVDESDFEESRSIKAGEVLKASSSRNFMFHKKAFALLKIGFDNQSVYESIDVYRKVLTIKAGYFDEAPNKNGEPYYFAKSLSFEKMSASEFEKWYTSTLNIISNELKNSPKSIRDEVEEFFK